MSMLPDGSVTPLSLLSLPIRLFHESLSIQDIPIDRERGSGAGSGLPAALLILTGVSTAVAVFVSCVSIFWHLKNYTRPVLQREVVRIMVMVPLYALASLIALFSLDAAFFIDTIRDIYEAFVIYCFFQLLLSYLGGERSLLIMLHGRPPKAPLFPANLFKHEIDVSDPHTFLFLKRGILQYVQVKPVLTIVTLILKATGKYNEGNFRANSGYLYCSIVYNASICLSLYCLAMFWVVVSQDLKPFRPVPKFLCVKGILFFSFWQSISVSLLVAAGAIKKLGPYTDEEHISVGLTDMLVCIEMPFFAIAHMYAFPPRDFIDQKLQYVARMPIMYAARDAFGIRDVIEDSKATLRGEGMDYREFEPSEGFMHQGAARERRIKAGLRYSKGGKRKYWLPRAEGGRVAAGRLENGVNNVIGRVAPGQSADVHAPLLENEADDVVHAGSDLRRDSADREWGWLGAEGGQDEGYGLPFGTIDPEDEEMFENSKRYLFGDYNYPTVDVSSESARTKMWVEEERILRDELGAWVSPIRVTATKQYGAIGTHPAPRVTDAGSSSAAMRETGKGKSVLDTNERLVDYDQDRTPAGEESGEFRLKWTNVRRQGRSGSRPSSANAGTSQRLRKHSDVSTSSAAKSPTSGSGARVRSPPDMSRTSSRTLPPDAVDLVVEDQEAAEEDREWERRKGEPALTGAGLRKVYRRGFVVDTDKGRAEGEVEINPEAQRADRDAVDVRMEEPHRFSPREIEEEDQLIEELDGTIARAETPPVHARVFDFTGEDDNPWA